MVAARVAEIDFAVVDHGVAPVGDVQRAVRAMLHVDGAEGEVGGAVVVGELLVWWYIPLEQQSLVSSLWLDR